MPKLVNGKEQVGIVATKKRTPPPPYLCSSCERVWEYIIEDNNRRRKQPRYLYDFPKIGCSPLKCPECEDRGVDA